MREIRGMGQNEINTRNGTESDKYEEWDRIRDEINTRNGTE